MTGMNRLVALALDENGQVRDDVAARIIAGLSRSELKRFLAAFRLELKRRVVQVGLAGKADGALDRTLARAYPGRALQVAQDDTLGPGSR